MNRYVIAEPEKCISCRTCEIACVMAHPDENGKVAMVPGSFMPRLRLVRGENVSAPVQCRHCDDAACVKVCPSGALIYSDKTVQVLQERCIGCQNCVIACPYGAMSVIGVPTKPPQIGFYTISSFKSQAHKCDLCVDHTGGPACIPVCPTKALHLVDPDAEALLAKNSSERAAAPI